MTRAMNGEHGLGEGLAQNKSLESLTIKICNDDESSNDWELGLGEGLARNTSLESFMLVIANSGATRKESGMPS